MPEFIEIQRKLVDVLLHIPGMDSYEMRSSLLQGLPDAPLVRTQAMARVDLNHMIDGLQKLGRLSKYGGARPLIVVADNALQYVPASSDVAETLNGLKRALAEFYGGEAQPTPAPLSPGEEEALIFGPQRDTRLPFAFVEGARTVALSIARLAVPRIFNGQQQDGLGFGTGWLIAPGLLITNHHVIECRSADEPPATPTDFRLQAEQVVARFDFYREQDLIAEPRLECRGAHLLTSNKQLDYALLELIETSKIADREPLKLPQAQPALVRGNRLNIVQHPGGGSLQYAIRNNFFVQMGHTNNFIRYQTDTERGASGSPVCDDGWQVLALHHASTPVSETQAPQEVIDGQPVTVTILNEAIAIHSILADLPQPVRQRILAAQHL